MEILQDEQDGTLLGPAIEPQHEHFQDALTQSLRGQARRLDARRQGYGQEGRQYVDRIVRHGHLFECFDEMMIGVLPVVGGSETELGPHHLDDREERAIGIFATAVAAQRLAAVAGGHCGQVSGQAALADTGLARQNEQPAVAPLGAGPAVSQQAKLDIAIDQRGRIACPVPRGR